MFMFSGSRDSWILGPIHRVTRLVLLCLPVALQVEASVEISFGMHQLMLLEVSLVERNVTNKLNISSSYPVLIGGVSVAQNYSFVFRGLREAFSGKLMRPCNMRGSRMPLGVVI